MTTYQCFSLSGACDGEHAGELPFQVKGTEGNLELDISRFTQRAGVLSWQHWGVDHIAIPHAPFYVQMDTSKFDAAAKNNLLSLDAAALGLSLPGQGLQPMQTTEGADQDGNGEFRLPCAKPLCVFVFQLLK
eukprot:gene25712-11369_t